ncbi:MAG: Hpt domain-containing protein [Lachnospiraceae bacterium]|nr:Hpt domain-containing protein [Lachnospiraceae bacterium]
MDAEQKKFLEEKGFDVDGTMKRFLNNEALYMKCLRKFLDDPSYEKLKEAYEKGNCKEAFEGAHTMKGFVSNLGINEIYHLLIPMVEKLRVQDMNLDDEMKRLEVLYEDTYKIIENL